MREKGPPRRSRGGPASDSRRGAKRKSDGEKAATGESAWRTLLVLAALALFGFAVALGGLVVAIQSDPELSGALQDTLLRHRLRGRGPGGADAKGDSGAQPGAGAADTAPDVMSLHGHGPEVTSAPASATAGTAAAGAAVAGVAAAGAQSVAGGENLLQAGRAAVVVIAHDRPQFLTRCLDSLLSQPDAGVFSFFVSLDHSPSFGTMEAVVTEKVASGNRPIGVWRKPEDSRMKNAVAKIAAHFRFALGEAFDTHSFEFAVFLENDLEASPDFLWYFRRTAWLLQEDPSLFCVSAWNDNGFKELVSDERRLFRTDYFPGLGWMIRQDTWELLRDNWPLFPSTGWDHWMRHGSGLRPRECVVPEVPRTLHFGEGGTNVKKGSGIMKLLERMARSNLPSGELGDVAGLMEERYHAELLERLRGGVLGSVSQLDGLSAGQLHLLPYKREEYAGLAKRLTIYPGQPRATHRGVVLTRHPKTGAPIALVDRRQGLGILPDAERIDRHPQLQEAAAAPDESCDQVCGGRQMRCQQDQLEFLNECPALKRAFPCETGCGHQVGEEIPAYVSDKARDTHGQCLVTDEATPTCKAHHPATSRLCACVPL